MLNAGTIFFSSWECDVLSHLLQAQILMSEWQFLPSLLQLHSAHSKLQEWRNAANVKEVSWELEAMLCFAQYCYFQFWLQVWFFPNKHVWLCTLIIWLSLWWCPFSASVQHCKGFVKRKNQTEHSISEIAVNSKKSTNISS